MKRRRTTFLAVASASVWARRPGLFYKHTHAHTHTSYAIRWGRTDAVQCQRQCTKTCVLCPPLQKVERQRLARIRTSFFGTTSPSQCSKMRSNDVRGTCHRREPAAILRVKSLPGDTGF